MNYPTKSALASKGVLLMKLIKNLIFAGLLLFSLTGIGQDIPDPMSPPRLVNDYAGLFSENQFRQTGTKTR